MIRTNIQASSIHRNFRILRNLIMPLTYIFFSSKSILFFFFFYKFVPTYTFMVILKKIISESKIKGKS